MNYIKDLRDINLANNLLKDIALQKSNKVINIMEVCGTHTMALVQNGINDLLPENINMISGPGCPVCVTPISYIDTVLELCKRENVIITTFGDMIKVTGTESSLQLQKAKGKDIRIVYSPVDTINIAKTNKDKEVIFLAVGFETTIPIIGLTILKAKEERIKNLSFLQSIKTMPNIMRFLLNDKEINIDGFICPGHVSTILGAKAFEFIGEEFKLPAVIAGFEPCDLLAAINLLIKMIIREEYILMNLYKRAVKCEGNNKAQLIMNEVFEKVKAEWRGIGKVESTGLKIKEKYKIFDAEYKLDINISENNNRITDCLCGDILKGLKKPTECNLFRTTCNPNNPIGACMVSKEGSCNIYYSYNK